MRRWIAIVIIVVVVGGAGWWFLRNRASNNEEEQGLAIVEVTRGDLRVTVAATGVLEPLTTVEVKSRSGGEIKTLYVEAGDRVEAGDLIAQLDPTELQSQVEQAQAQVVSSHARVEQARYSAAAQREQTDTGVIEARAALESARARLRQSEAELEQTRSTTEESVAQARARLASAKVNLSQARAQEEVEPALSAAEIRQAEASLERSRQALAALQAGNRPEEIAQAKTRVDEARAAAETAAAELRRQERLAERGFVSQQALEQAQQAHTSAQAQLESARQAYELSKAGPREEEIEQARAQVRQAEAALEVARTQQVQIEIREGERESAEVAVAEAEAGLRSAEAGRRTIDVREEDLKTARLSVEQAEAALRRAEASELTDEVRAQEIRSAMSDLRRTQSQLDDVHYSFEHTTVVAPRSGVVLTKHVEEGTVIPAGTAALAQGTAIVTIADITEMYVMANVDEVDISRVALGQDVEINVETLPNARIRGRVEKIFPNGTEQENVVYFPVRIKVIDLHPDLRPGMTADATILTAERMDVLLVPDAAIDRSGGETKVQVLPAPDAEPEDRMVEVGVTDWEQTEIISGIEVGETVVLPSGAPLLQMDEGRGNDPGRSARRATHMIQRGRR